MSNQTETITPEEHPAPDKNHTRRKRLFIGLFAVIIACAIGYGAYWYLYASRFVSTDNAYTATEVAQVTPSVSGTVQAVNVVDTQEVKAGDILVVIDEIDARLALNQAIADESQAHAQLAAAQADLKKAKIDLQRRKALIGSGSVSGDELTSAENAYESAKAHIDQANAAIAQAKARAEQARVDPESVKTQSDAVKALWQRIFE